MSLSTQTLQRCRQDLLEIYNYALQAVKPEKIIKENVRLQGNTLIFRSQNLEPIEVSNLKNTRLHVIGGGKSVLGMACGLGDLVKQTGHASLFSHGTLSIPIGLKSTLDKDLVAKDLLSHISTQCLFGSKDNLPDENSVNACDTIMNEIKLACLDDRLDHRESLFIVLISGGGSACLTSPRLIDLKTKLKLIHYLVQKGADIVELNKVRRYFSKIKAGRLAKEILLHNPEARVISLILSDVIGDPVEFIASGPTYISDDLGTEQQVQSMLYVLNKYGYQTSGLPAIPTETDCKSYDRKKVFNCIIGNNKTALNAAQARARVLGYEVDLLATNMQGDTEEIVSKMIDRGRDIFSSNLLVIAGGEATVKRLPGQSWGKGGRLQEMALNYLIMRLEKIMRQSESKASIDMFLAGSTDGQDGPTDVAACLTSIQDLESASTPLDLLLEVAKNFKQNHDSYNFLSLYLPDTLIKTGLTGTNVMDLYFHLYQNKRT